MLDRPAHTPNRCTLRGSRPLFLVTYLAVVVLAAACDESFDPIAPSPVAFSIFGYLDASADTQWIRIMPIRPLRVTSQDMLDATVTLEQLGTGRLIALRDSLFRFARPADPDLGAEGVYVHNFWTREAIEPGASYRFSARRDGEEPAEAVMEIPRDYEIEVGVGQLWKYPDYPMRFRAPDRLRITGVKHLPFFTAITHYSDSCGPAVARTLIQSSSANDEIHLLGIEKPRVEQRKGCGPLKIENSEIWIVGSVAAWPVGEGYSPGGLGETDLTTNVSNAVGFLGGVLTRLIPYEDCALDTVPFPPSPPTCWLRYTPETATVSGTVTETRCDDGPMDSVKVELTELDRDTARIRTAFSNRVGEFSIGALQPGIPHILRAGAAQLLIDSAWDMKTGKWVYKYLRDIYTLHTHTLTLLPGEQVEYDISLQRLTACSEPPPRAR